MYLRQFTPYTILHSHDAGYAYAPAIKEGAIGQPRKRDGYLPPPECDWVPKLRFSSDTCGKRFLLFNGHRNCKGPSTEYVGILHALPESPYLCTFNSLASRQNTTPPCGFHVELDLHLGFPSNARFVAGKGPAPWRMRLRKTRMSTCVNVWLTLWLLA